MPTQIELLQEAIEELEKTCDPENPFLKGLKTQLIGMERQAERAMEREQFNLSVGYTPKTQKPEPEDIAAFKLYEKRIAEISKGENGKGELG